MAAPVIMQPQFQQSVLFFPAGPFCSVLWHSSVAGLGQSGSHSWRGAMLIPCSDCSEHRVYSLQYIDQVIGVGFASRAVPRSVLEETVVLFFVVDVPVVPDYWHSSLTLWTSL